MHILKKRYFTLLEVLVSMGVFSLLMLALMQFFSAAQGVWEKTGRRADVFDGARIALDIMSADLSSAVYQNDFDANQFQFFSYDKTARPGKIIFASQQEDGNAEICYSWNSGDGTLCRKILKEGGTKADGSDNPFKNNATPIWFTRADSPAGGSLRSWVTAVNSDGDPILENVLDLTVQMFNKSLSEVTTIPNLAEGSYIQIPYLVRVQLVVVSAEALEKLANRGKAAFLDVRNLYTGTDGLSDKIRKGIPPNENDAETDEMVLFKGCQVFNRAVIIDRGQY